MEFGFVLFLLSAALFEHSAGFTTWLLGSCSGSFTEQEGSFASPDYPYSYPNYAHCTWTIMSLENKFIILRFDSVNIESSQGCSYDAVRVYDGSSTSSPLLGILCGSLPRTFHSSGNNLTIIFSSDGSNTRRGFVAYWYFTDVPVTPTPEIATTPNWDGETTDYNSCRYNCGYNLNGCSCSSSCEYSGNCCPDYYNYCYFTTTPPEIETTTNWDSETTDYNSCRYNCGYNLNGCSCSSSCEYSGNCCPDYYNYCYFTTTPPAVPMCRNNCGSRYYNCSCESSCVRYGICCHDYYDYCSSIPSPSVPSACGGRLHGSGSISSPYYPNYYHDGAYCEWQLSAPAGQTIFLSFQDLDLERCCSCDYLKVYDGSYTGSRLLGTVCHNDTHHQDFQSSSSYMTVLFRSDFSGVGRGFKASFTSSLNPRSGRVDCSSEKMNIVIRKSYLDSMGFNWNDLYLDDHRCTPSTDYYHVIFNFPLHSCSTKRETDNGRIIYTNNVRAAQSTSGEITRQETHFLMHVMCVMERDSSVGTLYEAQEIRNATISGMGRFNTTMAFYPSSSFSYPITISPYKVGLNQQVYVQVQLTRAEPTLQLFIDTCVASPNRDFSIRIYDLIRNGCRRDNTVSIYRNGNRYYAQFGFRAFKFLRAHEEVFLRCDVIICADNDYNSRCRQGCRYRKKRSLSSDHHTEVVTVGPITLKGPEKAVAKVEDKN